MTAAGMLGLLALLLSALLVLGVAGLAAARRASRLRERVRALRPSSATASPIPAPSIRMAPAPRSGVLVRLFRLLRYDPDAPGEKVVPWPVVALAGGAVVVLAVLRLSPMFGIAVALPVGLLSGVLLVRGIFGWQHRRYCDAIFQQIPDALGLMVRAIRAGLPLAEALRGISREMASPTREEFARVVSDMAIGRPVEVALMRLHERTGLTEYAFLAVTLGLQSQTGGSLAETLDNLADMVRKRVAMAKRAKALAAEARMQAGLLCVLPFIAAIGMSFLQPFYLETFTQNPTGQRMAMVGFGLMLLGLLTIRWLIRQAGRD